MDFGRKVQVDKVVIHLRADFPHDKVWSSGVLVFGDQRKLAVHFEHTAEPQVFHLDRPVEIYSLRLEKLKQDEPLDWGCAAPRPPRDATRLAATGHTLRAKRHADDT